MKSLKANVALSAPELRAILIGLREYLYFVDERRLKGILDEMECPASVWECQTGDLAKLEKRIAAFLDDL